MIVSLKENWNHLLHKQADSTFYNNRINIEKQFEVIREEPVQLLTIKLDNYSLILIYIKSSRIAICFVKIARHIKPVSILLTGVAALKKREFWKGTKSL